ncbi:MAG: hypothetical protein U0938_12135 [Thiobacillus sp.]|nr:hypothetical protein [Thiobacillus sp.]
MNSLLRVVAKEYERHWNSHAYDGKGGFVDQGIGRYRAMTVYGVPSDAREKLDHPVDRRRDRAEGNSRKRTYSGKSFSS